MWGLKSHFIEDFNVGNVYRFSVSCRNLQQFRHKFKLNLSQIKRFTRPSVLREKPIFQEIFNLPYNSTDESFKNFNSMPFICIIIQYTFNVSHNILISKILQFGNQKIEFHCTFASFDCCPLRLFCLLKTYFNPFGIFKEF